MDLSWLARGTGVPQLDDPVDLYTKQMNLAQIARAAQMQQMQMKKTQEADDDSTALRGVLGELHAGGYSDQAIQQAIGKAPRASGAILQAATAARKAQGDYQNDVAKTQETRTKTAAQQLEILGGAAGAVVQNPTRQGLMAAQSLLAQNGIDPSALTPPPDADFVQHFSLLRDASLKAKDQAEIRDRGLSRDVTMRGQDLTADTAAAGHGVQARGQDMTAATARAGQGVTMRGQDLVNARAGEANAATASGAGRWVNDLERGVQVNMQTGESRPITTPAGPLGPRRANSQMSERALAILDQAEPIINQATGSYAGAGVDVLARGVGMSTPGAKATSQLKVLESALMMNQPRMEGPQSNLDVELYRQMAGKIGDPTVPAPMKMAALQAIRALHEKYAELGGGAPPNVTPKNPVNTSAPPAKRPGWSITQIQ